MFDLGHFIAGVIIAGLGVLSIKYNYQLVGIVGSQDWIESKFGAGSTYFTFKIMSILVIIGAMLYATGLSDPVLGFLLAPLVDAITPGN